MWKAGQDQLVQLNQNGNTETTFAQSVAAENAAMYERVFTAADFKAEGRWQHRRLPAQITPPPPASPDGFASDSE